MLRDETSSDTETFELTSAISRGDTEAFRAFYECWFDRAYRLARRATRRDESFCLDVVQDAMLRVVRSMPPLETEVSLERWLGRIVYTTALDRLRRESRRARRERLAAEARHREHRAEREDSLELDEQIEWVRARLDELEPAERRLLVERFGLGKTLEEVGATLGLSGNAVHGRLRRVLGRLRAAARSFLGFTL